jgi:hypothetical protein
MTVTPRLVQTVELSLHPLKDWTCFCRSRLHGPAYARVGVTRTREVSAVP